MQTDKLRTLTEGELSVLGMASIAYIRRVKDKDREAFSVHAADGSAIAIAFDFGSALSAIYQSELEPVSLH